MSLSWGYIRHKGGIGSHAAKACIVSWSSKNLMNLWATGQGGRSWRFSQLRLSATLPALPCHTATLGEASGTKKTDPSAGSNWWGRMFEVVSFGGMFLQCPKLFLLMLPRPMSLIAFRCWQDTGSLLDWMFSTEQTFQKHWNSFVSLSLFCQHVIAELQALTTRVFCQCRRPLSLDLR